MTDPAWRSKPSWYLVATDDQMIPPAQRAMSKRTGATVIESPGSHSVYVSRPETVAQLIKTVRNESDKDPLGPAVPREPSGDDEPETS